VVTTSESVVKLAIDLLTAAWPCTLSHEALLQGVRSGLQHPLPEEKSRALLDDLLEHLLTRGMAKYQLTAVQIPASDGNPRVDANVRSMALLSQRETDANTFNQWHEIVPLSVVERWLLPALDGSHDRSALIEMLLVHAQEGRVSFSRDGQPVMDHYQLGACAAEHVDLMLLRLPQMKLLRNH
jgi:hypothetical protein